MQAVPGGKHCSQCMQTVVDFTKMTDAALISYLQQYPKGCGLYRPDQLGRNLTLPQVRSSQRGVNWLVALLLLFFGWMKDGIAQRGWAKSKARHTTISLRPVPSMLKTGSTVPVIEATAPINPDPVLTKQSGQDLFVVGARSVGTVYVVDGIQVYPPPAESLQKNLEAARYTMDPPGRKTLKGEDLPHSFRLEDH